MTLAHWYGELRRFDWHDLSDLEAIGYWPVPVRTLILLLLGLGLGGGDILLLQGAQSSLQQAAQETAALRDELQQKNAVAAALGVEEGLLNQVEAALASRQAQLPPRAAIPALLDTLTQMARQRGLLIDELSLRQEVPHDFYMEQSFLFELRGDYHALGAFVDAMASLPLLLTAQDFSIKSTQDAAVLQMRLEASTYHPVLGKGAAVAVMPAALQPPLSMQFYRATALRSPFAVDTPSTSAEPDTVPVRQALEAFALEQLTMSGTLERQGQRWALIRSVDGHVTRVGLGARLGHDHGRIVRITRERVDLIERVSDGTGWRERENSLSLPRMAAAGSNEQGAQ